MLSVYIFKWILFECLLGPYKGYFLFVCLCYIPCSIFPIGEKRDFTEINLYSTSKNLSVKKLVFKGGFEGKK